MVAVVVPVSRALMERVLLSGRPPKATSGLHASFSLTLSQQQSMLFIRKAGGIPDMAQPASP